MNYREAWANGEIEAGTLVDRIEEQAREIERLKEGQESLILVRDDYKKQAYDYRARWASAIASGNAPVGAIEAIRAEFPLFDDADLDQEAHHCEWSVQHDRKRLHALLDGLNQQPASGGDENAEFEKWAKGRATPLRLTTDEVGLYVKEVTGVAHEAWQARAALPVREAVAEGWQLVPVEPTKEMQLAALPHVNRMHTTRDIWVAMCAASIAAPSPSREGNV